MVFELCSAVLLILNFLLWIQLRKERKANLLFHEVAKTVSSSPNPLSLHSVTEFIVSETGCDFCFVAEVQDSKPDQCRQAETLSLSTPQGPLTSFSYSLSETPCMQVVKNQTLCFYEENVAHLFPNDKMLADLGIESYVGVPLWSLRHEVVGLLVVLSRKKLSDQKSKAAESLLRLFGARVASDVEAKVLQRDNQKRQQLLTNLSNEIHKLNKEAWYYKMSLQRFNASGEKVPQQDQFRHGPPDPQQRGRSRGRETEALVDQSQVGQTRQDQLQVQVQVQVQVDGRGQFQGYLPGFSRQDFKKNS